MAVADARICSSLEDEVFLEKVLQHLVDDGIYECRRVCRKWREVCGRLRVELKLRNWKDLPVYGHLFPNASSLLVSERCQLGEDFQSLMQLTHLSNMNHLSFNADPGHLQEDLSAVRTFRHLQSLTVGFYSEDAIELYSSLQFLTKLTRLDLDLYKHGPLIDLPPITQLCKLRELVCVDSPFLNPLCQFLFPTPCLTSLSLASCFRNAGPQYTGLKNRILEIILLHAGNVRCLALELVAVSLSYREWKHLTGFGTLQSLTLSCTGCQHLPQTLRQMKRLSELDLDYAGDRVEELFSAALSLNSLRSLRISCDPWPGATRFGPHVFDHFSQLTKLSIRTVYSGKCLSSLTGLIDLEICRQEVPCDDLSDGVAHILGLEKLSLAAGGDAHLELRSNSLAQLRSLRSIYLHTVLVEDDFVWVLSSLPGLTHLWFCTTPDEGHVLSFLSQLTLLSNLRVLGFASGKIFVEIDLCNYLPEGSLPRVRDVYAGDTIVTEVQRQELFRRLPCLRMLNSRGY